MIKEGREVAKKAERSSKKTGLLRVLIMNVLILAAILVLIEGVSGYLVFVHHIGSSNHIEYDPLLGWSSKAGVDIPDFYGPGIAMRTNRRGFRNDSEFAPRVPAGRIRVICSGDSFTLGYGVDNGHSWCQLLARIDPRLETVNMGQAGYGIDQAYLWYERDGIALEHQLQAFAFINDDFDRMARAEFLGYAKPVLKIEGGRLAVKGVPAPGPANGFLHRLLESSAQLGTVRVLRAASRALGLEPAGSPPRHDGVQETRAVAAKVFDALQRLNSERGSALVLVLFPVPEELESGDYTAWPEFVRREAKARGIPFIDTTPAFKSLPPSSLREMFVRKGPRMYPGSEGHFTNKGNEFAAKLIYDAVKDLIPSK